MRRYLIIEHMWKETYTTNVITKDDLLDVKKGNSRMLIDTQNGTYFNPETNEWKEIKKL